MAQSLEKVFLQKVAQMPQDEIEFLPPTPRGRGAKTIKGRKSRGEKPSQIVCSVAFVAQEDVTQLISHSVTLAKLF